MDEKVQKLEELSHIVKKIEHDANCFRSFCAELKQIVVDLKENIEVCQKEIKEVQKTVGDVCNGKIKLNVYTKNFKNFLNSIATMMSQIEEGRAGIDRKQNNGNTKTDMLMAVVVSVKQVLIDIQTEMPKDLVISDKST